MPYVIAGHYLGPGGHLTNLLSRQVALQGSLDRRMTHLGGGLESDPYYFADQDILNGLLMTVVPSELQVRIDRRLGPVTPFSDIAHRGGLKCSTADGQSPYLLHHILRKPWLAATAANAYVDVLRYVLHAPGVPVSIDPKVLPLRLRASRFYRLDRIRASAQSSVARATRGRLGIRRRLSRRRTLRG